MASDSGRHSVSMMRLSARRARVPAGRCLAGPVLGGEPAPGQRAIGQQPALVGRFAHGVGNLGGQRPLRALPHRPSTGDGLGQGGRSTPTDCGQDHYLGARPEWRLQPGPPALHEHIHVAPYGRRGVTDAVTHSRPMTIQAVDHLIHGGRRHFQLRDRARKQLDESWRQRHQDGGLDRGWRLISHCRSSRTKLATGPPPAFPPSRSAAGTG